VRNVGFIIAHLKKTRLDTAPDLEDLRDSSFIAQESDTVIMLWRESKRERGEVTITNNVTLSVQANRRTGKTGNVQMVFKEGKFYEQARLQPPVPEQPYWANAA
jgi:replicative DNA helicase